VFQGLTFVTLLIALSARSQTTLTNGAETAGSLLANSTNTYVFSATNGDAILLRAGAPVINPLIVLYGPGGGAIAAAGSGASGARDVTLAVQATNTGVFSVQVSSVFATAGSYLLNLAKIPGDFVVSPGDQGGPMTNGWKYIGTNDLGDMDMWSFPANTGDNIVLRMGAATFNPWIRLYGPTGTLVGSAGSGANGALVMDLALAATNSGTFTVVSSSFTGNGTGSYLLNLAQSPGAIYVAPGDEGGPLTNGWKHTGVIDLGDLDVWSFNANAGDNIVLRMGSTNFNPWIRLYGPTGTLLGSAGSGAAGALMEEIAVQATNSGSFTVVATGIGDGTGNYLLNFAQSPGAIFVAPGDEGGPLTNGWEHTGYIDLGDMDAWSFSATAGDNIVLRMGSTNFNPWIRLYGPTGSLLGSAGSGASGALMEEIAVQATNSGSFTLVATAIGNGSGNYLLNLARSPGAFFVAPGDDGGPLTNGWKHTGVIDIGDLDMWSFDASAGDNIVLRMGSATFNPSIRLYGPTGSLLGSAGSGASGALMEEIALQATNSGSFTVVATAIGTGTGAYLLNLAKAPGAIYVAPGDEGGIMTNGWKYIGTMDVGDLDVWTFAANPGDTILLRMAAAAFNPLIRLYGPTGTLVTSVGNAVLGNTDVNLATQATNGGNFTVVASTYSGATAGSYLVNLAKIPGAFFVAPGDEGGTLLSGLNQNGTIDAGDMDMWRFAGCHSQPIIVNCQKLSGTNFTPRVRLYNRSGALLATVANATLATISYSPTNSDIYTAIVDGANVNDSGTYQLSGSGVSDALSLCLPLVFGTNLDMEVIGGGSNTTFVVYTATNITTPAAQWLPILTNQFDQFGVSEFTNTFNPAEKQRYFRVQSQ
jgi:hypothetical protein